MSVERLRSALDAEPPPAAADLADADLADLAEAVEDALDRQRSQLRAAIDDAYGHVPRLLRGPLRKVLGG
jgi:hypothetical protein